MIKTFTGNNSYLLKSAVDELVSSFVKEQGDLALERIDGEDSDMQRINEALTSLPFLATRKLVVLRHPSAQKSFTEKIDSILQDVPETTDVLIIEPKLDKRSSYFKALKKQTEYQEYNEPDEANLMAWLVDEAGKLDANLTRSDAQFLIARVGQNQRLLSNELHKLVHYDAQISRQTIELLTEATPQSTIFELLDAALAGHLKRAMELYEEQRKQKVEPQAILAMMAWQLHVLAIIVAARGKDPAEIAREAKINPYVVRKSSAIARRLGATRVSQLVSDLLEIDISLKSKSIDADEAMRNFILKIARI